MRFFELDGTISIQLVRNLKDIILIRLLYSIRFFNENIYNAVQIPGF